MSTKPGNPIAAAVGENQFAPEAVFGQVERQAQLTQEAPISGAPMPVQPAGGPAPASAPAPAPGPPAGTVPVQVLPAYSQRLAETWGALASMPGVSPRVKEMARLAKLDVKKGR